MNLSSSDSSITAISRIQSLNSPLVLISALFSCCSILTQSSSPYFLNKTITGYTWLVTWFLNDCNVFILRPPITFCDRSFSLFSIFFFCSSVSGDFSLKVNKNQKIKSYINLKNLQFERDWFVWCCIPTFLGHHIKIWKLWQYKVQCWFNLWLFWHYHCIIVLIIIWNTWLLYIHSITLINNRCCCFNYINLP